MTVSCLPKQLKNIDHSSKALRTTVATPDTINVGYMALQSKQHQQIGIKRSYGKVLFCRMMKINFHMNHESIISYWVNIKPSAIISYGRWFFSVLGHCFWHCHLQCACSSVLDMNLHRKYQLSGFKQLKHMLSVSRCFTVIMFTSNNLKAPSGLGL